ncbi:MAG TPA: hypothetical protein VNT56_07425 [Acidimicrobiales bacterium]|jgi:hypothetical protein|nr:hypothetical protein [Acidimicrobiales bacterium]
MSDGSAPEEVAKTFVDAVAWGEHHTVWDLLSSEGRETVLRVGATRGMDKELALRLRDGAAATAEREEFLADLVRGLRADLAGNDLDNLEAERLEDGDPVPEAGQVTVMLVSPLPPVLAQPGLPVAEVKMRDEQGQWRVDRLLPRTSKPK